MRNAVLLNSCRLPSRPQLIVEGVQLSVQASFLHALGEVEVQLRSMHPACSRQHRIPGDAEPRRSFGAVQGVVRKTVFEI